MKLIQGQSNPSQTFNMSYHANFRQRKIYERIETGFNIICKSKQTQKYYRIVFLNHSLTFYIKLQFLTLFQRLNFLHNSFLNSLKFLFVYSRWDSSLSTPGQERRQPNRIFRWVIFPTLHFDNQKQLLSHIYKQFSKSNALVKC